jgi:integrase
VRFHDLRRTWASYLIQQGATDRELQELGSWKSAAMVKRYAQLRVKHLTPAAGLIDRVLPPTAC